MILSGISDVTHVSVHHLVGVRHEGTPEGKISPVERYYWSSLILHILSGKFEQIGDVKSYVATPSIDYPKDKVLLYLPDVFGFQLINHKVRPALTMFME